MIVYTVTGKELELVEPPLGKGGEGAVYRMSGYPGRVAKIYTKDADTHKEKIEAMASMSATIESSPRLKNVAWPMAALYLDKSAKRFAGFGMRFIEQFQSMEALHEYPAPTGVSVPMKEKVDYLIDLADVTEAFHSLGQVIGDFNDNNLNMTANGHKVGLVDVDSLHASISGKTYKCVVCMSGYMAPELIKAVRGTTFEKCAGKTFTKETDRFSLAVHVFRMLFNGAHPYHCAGIPGPNGSVKAPLPMEKRVEQGSTPFFRKVPGAQVPPFAPDVKALPPYMTSLFERAFVDGQVDPAKRPTASEWKKGLEKFRSDLVQCKRDSNHWHWKEAGACPYCEADVRSKAKGPSKLGGSPVLGLTPKPAYASATVNGASAILSNPGQILPAAHTQQRTAFWGITVLSAIAAFLVLGVLTPVCSLVSIGLFGSYPVICQFLFGAGAIGGTCLYNYRYAKDYEPQTYALSIACSAGGMAAVAAGMLAVSIVIALVMALLSIVIPALVVIAIIAGLCSS